MLCRECKVRGACWHSGEKDWAERELDVLRGRAKEPDSVGVVKKRREILVALKEQTLAVIESWCEADRVAAEAEKRHQSEVDQEIESWREFVEVACRSKPGACHVKP